MRVADYNLLNVRPCFQEQRSRTQDIIPFIPLPPNVPNDLDPAYLPFRFTPRLNRLDSRLPVALPEHWIPVTPYMLAPLQSARAVRMVRSTMKLKRLCQR